MELTYTDASFNDVGLLDFSSADFAFGADENDFEIVLNPGSGVPVIGALVYAEGGDVGGIVRGYESEYDTDILRVVGDTWAGIFDSHVLCPPSGSAYFTVSGDLNACIGSLISQLGLSSFFQRYPASSGRSISHTFKGDRTDSAQSDTGRYMGGWAALWQMLVDNGCKARFTFDPEARTVTVRGLGRRNYTDSESIDAGAASVKVSQRRPVNHLVCLGQGEMAARTVVHLYADDAGRISTTQTLTGLDEVAEVYDNTGAETAAALTSDGTAKLKELWADSQEVTVGTSTLDVEFELGDLIGGTDVQTGVYAEAVVSKKVVTVEGTATAVKYESTVRS